MPGCSNSCAMAGGAASAAGATPTCTERVEPSGGSGLAACFFVVRPLAFGTRGGQGFLAFLLDTLLVAVAVLLLHDLLLQGLDLPPLLRHLLLQQLDTLVRVPGRSCPLGLRERAGHHQRGAGQQGPRLALAKAAHDGKLPQMPHVVAPRCFCFACTFVCFFRRTPQQRKATEPRVASCKLQQPVIPRRQTETLSQECGSLILSGCGAFEVQARQGVAAHSANRSAAFSRARHGGSVTGMRRLALMAGRPAQR